MYATDLASLIDRISDAYLKSGLLAKKPTYARLIKDLRAFDDTEVDSVVLKLLAGEGPPKANRKVSRRGAEAEIRQSKVAQYLDWLESVKTESVVDEVVETISRDRLVRSGKELTEILKAYSGGALSGTTKAKKLDGLRTAFRMRERGEVTVQISGSARGV